jgi:xanthine dehydrogenase small subunit
MTSDSQTSIRFVLDGEVIELSDVDPTRTVLQYLREDAGKVGTKEGCAEGDVRQAATGTCHQFVYTIFADARWQGTNHG